MLLIDEGKIKAILNDCVKQYAHEFDRYKRNNELLQANIEKLLNVPSGTLKQSEALRLKSLGQIIGLAGKGSKKTIPLQKVQYLKLGKPVTEEVPDFNAPNVIDFAGWNQPDYLLYNLYFSLELYINIELDIIKSPIEKRLTLSILKEEIWITANAYHIRTSYARLISIQDKKDEEALDNFVDGVISVFIETAKAVTGKKTVELSFPCGSKGHAIYLTFIFLTQKNILGIRIDNSDESKPVLITDFNVTDTKALQNFKVYLKNVCLVLDKPKPIARKTIYDTEKTYALARSDYANDSPPHQEQTVENCVVEGFQISLWYRLQKYLTTRAADAFFKWMHKNSIQFASISHETPGFFEASIESERDSAYTTTKKNISAIYGFPIKISNDKYILRNRVLKIDGVEKKIGYFESIINEFNKQSSESIQLLACYGMFGVGKTWIVSHFFNNSATNYRLRIWLTATDEKGVASRNGYINNINQLVILYKLNINQLPTDKPEIIARKFKIFLQNNPGWLLIIDNAPQQNDINDLLPDSGGTILITTSNPNWTNKLEIFPFNPDESEILVKNFINITDMLAVKNLTNKLGDLPLAISQACAYINQTPRMTIEKYINDFEKKLKFILSTKRLPPGSEHETLWVTWEMLKESMIEKARQDKLPINSILALIGCFDYTAIPYKLIEACIEEENDLALSCLAILNDYSLIQKDEINDYFSLNIITHSIIREDTNLNLNQLIKVITKFSKLIPAYLQTAEDYYQYATFVPHAESLYRLIKNKYQINYEGIDEEQFNLFLTIYYLLVKHYDALANPLKKLFYATKGRDLHNAVLEDNHFTYSYVHFLRSMASAEKELSHFQEELYLYKECFDYLNPENHPSLVDDIFIKEMFMSTIELASACCDIHKNDLAIGLIDEKCISYIEYNYKDDSITIAIMYHVLGCVYSSYNLEQSEIYLHKAFDILNKIKVGQFHELRVKLLHSLVNLNSRKETPDISYLKQLEEIINIIYPNKFDLRRVSFLLNKALTLEHLTDFDQAEQSVKNAIDIINKNPDFFHDQHLLLVNAHAILRNTISRKFLTNIYESILKHDQLLSKGKTLEAIEVVKPFLGYNSETKHLIAFTRHIHLIAAIDYCLIGDYINSNNIFRWGLNLEPTETLVNIIDYENLAFQHNTEHLTKHVEMENHARQQDIKNTLLLRCHYFIVLSIQKSFEDCLAQILYAIKDGLQNNIFNELIFTVSKNYYEIINKSNHYKMVDNLSLDEEININFDIICLFYLIDNFLQKEKFSYIESRALKLIYYYLSNNKSNESDHSERLRLHCLELLKPFNAKIPFDLSLEYLREMLLNTVLELISFYNFDYTKQFTSIKITDNYKKDSDELICIQRIDSKQISSDNAKIVDEDLKDMANSKANKSQNSITTLALQKNVETTLKVESISRNDNTVTALNTLNNNSSKESNDTKLLEKYKYNIYNENYSAQREAALKLIRDKKYEDALKLFNKLSELKISDYRNHNNIGYIYLQQKKYKEAIADYTKCLNFSDIPDQDKIDVLNSRAYCLRKLNKFEEALKDYWESFEINNNKNILKDIKETISDSDLSESRKAQLIFELATTKTERLLIR